MILTIRIKILMSFFIFFDISREGQLIIEMGLDLRLYRSSDQEGLKSIEVETNIEKKAIQKKVPELKGLGLVLYERFFSFLQALSEQYQQPIVHDVVPTENYGGGGMTK